MQFAGAAEVFVSSAEGPRVRSQTREHAPHILAVFPVQSHTALSWRHEERGETTTAAADAFKMLVVVMTQAILCVL